MILLEIDKKWGYSPRVTLWTNELLNQRVSHERKIETLFAGLLMLAVAAGCSRETKGPPGVKRCSAIKIDSAGNADPDKCFLSLTDPNRIVWISQDNANDHAITFANSPFQGTAPYHLPKQGWVDPGDLKSGIAASNYDYTAPTKAAGQTGTSGDPTIIITK